MPYHTSTPEHCQHNEVAECLRREPQPVRQQVDQVGKGVMAPAHQRRQRAQVRQPEKEELCDFIAPPQRRVEEVAARQRSMKTMATITIKSPAHRYSRPRRRTSGVMMSVSGVCMVIAPRGDPARKGRPRSLPGE